LEAKVIDLEPRKRKRVKASPNSKFVGIEAIKRAQIEAGDREINEEDSDKTDKLSFILSYITIN
jgi:4-hydroxybenzoate polyprenyltransferase